MKTSTPWGPSQTSRRIGEGIVQHSTAGHGGLYVPPLKLGEMPAALRCNCYAGGGSWFEEDCEWALVALAFPHLFSPYEVFCAARTVRNFSDTYREARLWLALEAGEQVAALAEDFALLHAKEFETGSMSTSGGNWLVWASSIDGTERIAYETASYPPRSPYSLADLRAAGALNIKPRA